MKMLPGMVKRRRWSSFSFRSGEPIKNLEYSRYYSQGATPSVIIEQLPGLIRSHISNCLFKKKLSDGNYIIFKELCRFSIRHLSKPQRELKVADGSDKIKPQREAFSSVSITISNNLKTFDKSNHVFNNHPLT